MVRKKVLIRKRDNKIIDAGLAESPKTPTDPEVSEEFEEAKKLAGSGSSLLEQKLREHNSRTPELTANDVDADWADSDVGTETVGGDNMTPDQSVVDDIGKAVGVNHDDEEPLRTSVEQKSDRRTGMHHTRPPQRHTRESETSREDSHDRPSDWD